MPKPHTVVLTRAARVTGVPLDELHNAALAAAANVKDGDIWFRAFRVHGLQFALSTRLVVEVDCFPRRAPQTVLPPPAGRSHAMRGNRREWEGCRCERRPSSFLMLRLRSE